MDFLNFFSTVFDSVYIEGFCRLVFCQVLCSFCHRNVYLSIIDAVGTVWRRNGTRDGAEFKRKTKKKNRKSGGVIFRVCF